MKFEYLLSSPKTSPGTDIKMIEHLVEGLKTKLYAVRGYISQELKIKFEESRHLV